MADTILSEMNYDKRKRLNHEASRRYREEKRKYSFDYKCNRHCRTEEVFQYEGIRTCVSYAPKKM
eukprot:9537805-Ditylum_brightwellii.AAC.1